MKTLEDVRAELADIYRAARRGQLNLGDAKSFAYILNVLSGLTKETTLEERLAAIEAAMKGSAP